MDKSSGDMPVVMSIAGSDNSAGAGIQADLKTFSACGVYGLTAVTCVVSEVPGKVSALAPMTAEMLRSQIDLSFEAFPVAAVKTGMLYSRELIETVTETLARQGAGRAGGLHLVVDPVMVASSGDALLQPEAVEAYRSRLFPLASLITPNLDEAVTLLGTPIPDPDAMKSAAKQLGSMFRIPVLLKGGHLMLRDATDILVVNGECFEFTSPFLDNVSTHGTGCTFSAAITAHLALGMDLPESVKLAKAYIDKAIRHIHRWKNGETTTMALNHFPPA